MADPSTGDNALIEQAAATMYSVVNPSPPALGWPSADEAARSSLDLPALREYYLKHARALAAAGLLAVPAPAVDRKGYVTEDAIKISDGHMRAYIQRQVAMPHMKPEHVDAIQWTGRNFAELVAAFPEADARIVGVGLGLLVASVTGGELSFKVGWWLIRTDSGYLCAMFPWAFEERYEPSAGGDRG